MKLKSLLLGSAAAVGLSTGAFAADLATVVSSFDVCENLGISGTLQIASTDDCLQISGGVTYEFNWGDYNVDVPVTDAVSFDNSARNIDDAGFTGTSDRNLDWKNDLDWWLKFVGSAKSDFGTAKAVIKLSDKGDERSIVDEQTVSTEDINDVQLDEAYVSIGDTTKIIAGKRDASVFVDGDDEPFGFIGLFNSDAVDTGVDVLDGVLDIELKGRVIQLYHTIGDSGVTVSAGLENLDDDTLIGGFADPAGTAVGTLAYVGDSLTGHFSVAAGGILDGSIEDWKMHAGFTGTFDAFKLRAAVAGGSDDNGTTTAWNGLVTGQYTFDMFTLAAAMEAAYRSDTGNTAWGGSLTGDAAVTDTVSIAAGFRYYDADTSTANTETWQAAMKLVAKLTEALTATGEVGYYGTNIAAVPNGDGAFYGSAELAWAPGGQFTSSIKGEMNSLGAYKATFKASKTFD